MMCSIKDYDWSLHFNTVTYNFEVMTIYGHGWWFVLKQIGGSGRTSIIVEKIVGRTCACLEQVVIGALPLILSGKNVIVAHAHIIGCILSLSSLLEDVL